MLHAHGVEAGLRQQRQPKPAVQRHKQGSDAQSSKSTREHAHTTAQHRRGATMERSDENSKPRLHPFCSGSSIDEGWKWRQRNNQRHRKHRNPHESPPRQRAEPKTCLPTNRDCQPWAWALRRGSAPRHEECQKLRGRGRSEGAMAIGMRPGKAT